MMEVLASTKPGTTMGLIAITIKRVKLLGLFAMSVTKEFKE